MGGGRRLRSCRLAPDKGVSMSDPSDGGTPENASTGKRKYGIGKYDTMRIVRVENASMEKASTNYKDGKHKYGKGKYVVGLGLR